MEQKQRLFIYDRREIIILVALGIMVAAFAFTLGVHLGKHVTTQTLSTSTAKVPQTKTLADKLPNRQQLTEQGRDARTAADAVLSQTLQQEVEKTKIHLNTPRQVNLPTQTVSRNAGATTLSQSAVASAPISKPGHRPVEHAASAAHGKYTLQIASFPTAETAQSKLQELRAQGLHPFVRAAHVPGMGRRFRLFVGAFSTREQAEKAGRTYQSRRLIDSYLVSRSGD